MHHKFVDNFDQIFIQNKCKVPIQMKCSEKWFVFAMNKLLKILQENIFPFCSRFIDFTWKISHRINPNSSLLFTLKIYLLSPELFYVLHVNQAC